MIQKYNPLHINIYINAYAQGKSIRYTVYNDVQPNNQYPSISLFHMFFFVFRVYVVFV